MAPTRNTNISLDYWSIQKKNLISNIGADVILNNLDKYENLVHRYGENGLCEYDPAASTSATSSCARRIGAAS
jgi:iron complex outermembrane receptor protein